MPGVGDRVVFEGVKVGGSRREGELLSIDGRAVRVRWGDGTESLLFPGPGAMRVVQTAGRGSTARRDTSATGTIRGTVKKGSSKRTAAAGGDFRETKPSGVAKKAGAARGAGKATAKGKPTASEKAKKKR